jgi:hypothetical protein
MVCSAVSSRTALVEWPTEDEKAAHALRTVQGMGDAEAGDVLGVRRETVNRRVNAYLRKEKAFIAAFPDVAPILRERLFEGVRCGAASQRVA